MKQGLDHCVLPALLLGEPRAGAHRTCSSARNSAERELTPALTLQR
ncbi:MAG: hypothetical protein MRJ92_13200 [Nitrospira sp.]|nr:hypothetical protein [Nitrospira sp.]